MKRVLTVLFLTTILPAAPAPAQEVPREDYLRFSPLTYPRLIQQNDATRTFHLFGDRSDPGYRDADPVDGIDDERARVLESLAVRFAPFLVQNAEDIPSTGRYTWKTAIRFPCLWIPGTSRENIRRSRRPGRSISPPLTAPLARRGARKAAGLRPRTANRSTFSWICPPSFPG